MERCYRPRVDLKLRGLAALDPTAVPLPNGTEVATRVVRQSGDRHVPQGAVGRVVTTIGDNVDVRLVGVGVVRYRRADLLVRKAGQLRFARRRAAAWELLRPTVVVETMVGSRAWGLADETSDVDVRGIFVAPFQWTTGLATAPEDLVSLDGSATFWEAGKAIRQALRADPNTLETLFVEGARANDEIGSWILAEREAFVSVEIYGTFGRYALSQLKKLSQSLRIAEHRSLVLEWLRESPSMSLEAVAEKLALATGTSDALVARGYVKQLYRSLFDQGLLPENDFASLVTFAGASDLTFELPRDLHPKNAYNLLRLIATAIGWLSTGKPQFVVTGAVRERLLAIKRGLVPLDDVLREAEALTLDLENARRTSVVPAKPDVIRADRLLRRIREESARRWATGAPGPLGRDAPPVPDIDWEESEP